MLFPLKALPGPVLTILREAARHVLRRPVIAVAAVPLLADGRIVLIRRGDTGTWALPGGTLEWGETLRVGLERELLEEAGIERLLGDPELVGVFSRPDRDVRFHGVSVIVRARVEDPTRKPVNPLEILDVKAFHAGEVPRPLALGQDDMLDAALNGITIFE
jgi:8-oxo-dGTP diphosphatase